MQVKTKQKSQVFKPVTLEITFETAEELRMMRDMYLWNISIPNTVYPDDVRSQRVLKGIMDQIRDAVDRVKQGE